MVEMEVHHVSTLSQKVIDATYHAMRHVQDYSYSEHARRQTNAKGVAHWSYILNHGKLIELKVDRIEKRHRALLRTNDGHCAVFCWKDKRVVTAWWNSPDDNHATIDPNQYKNGVKHLV